MFFKKDRRSNKRLEIHCLAKYTLEDKSSAKKLSFIRNISAGGVMLYSEEDIPPGTVMNLEVNIPSRKRRFVVKGITRSIYEKTLRGVKGYYVGFEFIEINESDREALKKAIEG